MADRQDEVMHEEEHALLHQSRSAVSEPLNVEEGIANGEPGWQTTYYLQGSHFLSAWGQRMWEFAVGLIMLDLGMGSLTLVSAFGLLDGLTVVVAGPIVGDWIDRTDRLRAACTMYLLQNMSVAISAGAAVAALYLDQRNSIFWACVACTILAGSVSSAGALGATLSVEREWTKALCQGKSVRLAQLNAGMRRIDLTCLILSPVLVGFLMSYTSKSTAAFLIMAWNAIAWAPEWLLLRLAQSNTPALREETLRVTPLGDRPKSGLLSAWVVYCRQPVLPAAFALALLYLTVLSFGLLATAYLNWRGMSEAELSIYRGLGAIAGISATFIFPPMHGKLGLNVAGSLGIWWQLLSLAVAIAPAWLARAGVWTASSWTISYALVGGLVLSRLGLWNFDLCIGQMLQEQVPNKELGVVNGVQGSLAGLFQSTSYLAGLLLPDPEKFDWLMLGSWTMVFIAALMYTLWVLASRNQDEIDEEIEGQPALQTLQC